MQEAGLEILHFLDGLLALRDRRDVVMSSAVAAGIITPLQAWPEYFGEDEGTPGAFPSTDADMTGFQVEEATPMSFADDIEAMVAASERITLREQPEPERPQFSPLPDVEWT